MKDTLGLLFGSRKFLIVVFVTLVVAILVGVGRLPVAEFITTVEHLTAILVLSIGIEGAAEKWNAPPPPGPIAPADSVHSNFPPPMAPPPVTSDEIEAAFGRKPPR